jgi:purine-nucleoside phosphorylase
MSDPSHFGEDVPRAAERLRERLGAPALGVLLGSGFAPLAAALGAAETVPATEIPGYPRSDVAGHDGGIASVILTGGEAAWLFLGRLHLYEGHDASRVAFPVAVASAAGARAVVLTCAAGGLLAEDRPGDFAVIVDHVNLTGEDPIRGIPPASRSPQFLDLQGAYDPELASIWRDAAREAGLRMRDGVLASVPGPSYETPAEVRMLRALGADLVSMSTAVEAIAARYLGMRVAAIACVANRGARAEAGRAIRHDDVLARVREAVAASASALGAGLGRIAAKVRPEPR